MDSWGYGSEGKEFALCDEMNLNTDAIARSRTVVMGWDLKSPPFNFDNTRLEDSGRDDDGNLGFMELGFPDVTRKPPTNPFGGFMECKMGSSIVSSSTCISNSIEFSKEESSSRFSSTVGDLNGSESLVIDLKLGRFTDYQDAPTGKFPEEIPNMASIGSSLPEKRARTMSLTYQSPVCQVLGCNMDLSNSKDYHKRHKVCDAHSKTAKVIVNGIEQRFCQQCSRFHLLAEFDDGKRSCRKRLAGHNERRRKPQVDNQTGRNGKFHLPYNGTRFLGTSLPLRTSFNSSLFHNGIMQPEKYQTSNWSRPIKVEEEQYYNPHSATPATNQQLLPKSLFPQFGGNKQYSFMHGTGINTTETSNFCGSNNRYPQALPDPNSIPHFGLGSTSSGREGITIYDTEPTTGASDSSSALSLLSSQSQNSSSHSSGMPTGQPLFIQGNQSHYNSDQLSGKLFGLNPQTSTSLSSNRFSSSMEFDRFEPMLASDASNSVDFDLQPDGLFQGSEFMSSKDPFSHENATTVDLLQLSSQLQRVEHQRHSMQIKQENDTYFCLPIT